MIHGIIEKKVMKSELEPFKKLDQKIKLAAVSKPRSE